MDSLQKKKNEISKDIDDLVWDIKMKEVNIEKLEKEIKDSEALLNFLIKTKNIKEVE